jgi:hypothetical protein
VNEHIWHRGGGGYGMLCVGCLEKRLGRQLIAADFTENFLTAKNLVYGSQRLRDRMMRQLSKKRLNRNKRMVAELNRKIQRL